jgi:hypothetical protein
MSMMTRSVVRVPLLCATVTLWLTVACGSDGKSSTVSEDGGLDTGSEDSGPAAQCEAAEVPCTDQQAASLMLRDTKSGGEIREEKAPEGEFLSYVDATAGGLSGTLGYTYARFTAKGLERVDLSDEGALASSDWDIAFRRYVVRLNSGVSGPSCVKGARTAPGTTFAALESLPANLTFKVEQYFTRDTCEFVPDTSGIGAPQTLLGSFWTYPGCVAMTGNVYVVALASGEHVKLEVASYYEPEVQAGCNDTGKASDPDSAANLRIRWAFVE